MSVNIEDILLLKAQQDSANQGDNSLGMAAGAVGGAALGALGGGLRHRSGQEQLLERLVERTRKPLSGIPGVHNARPGARMAGGLVGLILGGALGAGASQLMQQESPSARLLAKLQTEGTLSAAESQQLEDVLADTYNNITG